MTRFLCVLLLVGLVATPIIVNAAPRPASPSASGHASARSDRAAGRTGASSLTLVETRSARGAVAGSIPVTLQAATPHTVRGTATWYCSATSACTRGYSPSDLVAAIDPSTGFHKGDQLRVRSGGKSVRVTIVDVCLCRGERVIDLTSGAFRRLAPLSRGVIPVSLELVGGIDVPLTRPAPTARPIPTAPQTDLEVK